MRERNADVPPEKRIEFRIGINLGDVIVEGRDLYGDGVNIAARLEGLAEPGGVCISQTVLNHARGKIAFVVEDLGEQALKNIVQPIHVYRLLLNSSQSSTVSRPSQPVLTLADKPSIAVLPFQNMSGDPEQEYFADGLTEDIITELSRISSMSVIARNSAFVYKGKPVDVKQVGHELGVRYVLEGGIRRASQRVRVTAQLVETTTGGHLWAEKYDRNLANIFDIQDEITRSVVASTQTQVMLREGAMADERPDFRTWDLAKRGWKKIYELTQESIEEAYKIAGELTRIDPSFAKGHQLLAAAAYHLALMGFCDKEDAMLGDALQSARNAIRLDDRDEYSHWILGGILGQGLGHHDKAIAAYRRAFELNPNFSLAFGSLGTVLALAGQPDDSIRNSEICISANPRDPSIFFRFSGLALAYFVAEDYPKAREWAGRSVARKREWWQGHALLASSCILSGQEDEARAAVRDWLAAFPRARISKLPPIPFKKAEDAKRFRDGIRRAGLPE
jgi:adenylate cyclase